MCRQLNRRLQCSRRGRVTGHRSRWRQAHSGASPRTIGRRPSAARTPLRRCARHTATTAAGHGLRAGCRSACHAPSSDSRADGTMTSPPHPTRPESPHPPPRLSLRPPPWPCHRPRPPPRPTARRGYGARLQAEARCGARVRRTSGRRRLQASAAPARCGGCISRHRRRAAARA
eukprot:scaffold34753_cov47-Phaeocystis_antarctica.AAC.3